MQSAFMKKTLAVAAVVSAGFFAQQSLAQSANCSYSISNEWNTGATAAITITNTSTRAINGWTVGWQYTTNRLSSSWNANVSGSNPYTASNISWNGTIQPGQSVQFGFQVDKRGGSAERPTITGNVCGGVASSSVSSAPVSSVRSSSSIAVSSSSVLSSAISAQQCNWYGTLYPLCVNTGNGWGYENNRSCISRTTCAAQPAPFGITGGSSSVALSSVISSSRASSSNQSSILPPSSSRSSSSSSIASSISTGGLNCTARVVNNWGSGYQLDVVINNGGVVAVNGWSVTLGFSENPQRTGGWNATIGGSGNIVTASNVNWNGTIAPGQSVSFGLQGNHDGSFVAPTCKVN